MKLDFNFFVVLLVLVLHACSTDENRDIIENNRKNNEFSIGDPLKVSTIEKNSLRADSQTLFIENNSEKNIVLTASNQENNNFSFEIISQPQYGSLNGTAPNVIYIPNQNFTGKDSFLFRVNNEEGASNTASINLVIQNSNTLSDSVTLEGKITYDFVPVNENHKGLNFDNILEKPSKGVTVQMIDKENNIIANTQTNSKGDYAFSVEKNTEVKIRVLAELFNAGDKSWDMKVVDNTNNNELYAMEGSLINVGVEDSFRDLHAPSGWDGEALSLVRTAAPFAILDTVYQAMHKILDTNMSSEFAPLVINWSPKNISTEGNIAIGQIGTSNYENGNLYILGDGLGDNDEYDTHVVAHEWGHYYEDTFSRSNSIGGSHGKDDSLDIRVAFSEGFGNSFAGMVLDDPIYSDTLFNNFRKISTGFFFDLESATTNGNPGWFSESSIDRILYDLYDSHDDSTDTLSLGFAPLHNVFINYQKNTSAFTSIFTFISALKDANKEKSSLIDDILFSHNIAPIEDVYGTGRTNRFSDYPYMNLEVGKMTSLTLSNKDGDFNKLSNIKFFKFSIFSTKKYKITLKQTNGSSSDPDFYLYNVIPLAPFVEAESFSLGKEETSVTLSRGEYLLEVRDANNIESANLSLLIE